MTLAAYTDANRFLDGTKLAFKDDIDAAPEATYADRAITSALYDSFGEVVNTWDIVPTGGEESTPGIIVEIAGMLMAAMRYDKVYSGEDVGEAPYAVSLREQAMGLLQQIASGSMTISDSGGIIITSGTAWASSDFWPNDTTVVQGTLESDRKFTMDQVF